MPMKIGSHIDFRFETDIMFNSSANDKNEVTTNFNVIRQKRYLSLWKCWISKTCNLGPYDKRHKIFHGISQLCDFQVELRALI